MCLFLHPLPPVFFGSGFPHHHGSLSRVDSIIDIPDLVPLVHSSHRSRGGLPVCVQGVLLLQGGVWRSGDGATTGARHHPHCCFTPGSLGWLEIKGRWEQI